MTAHRKKHLNRFLFALSAAHQASLSTVSFGERAISSGKKILIRIQDFAILTERSEMFGASEDQTAFDHSADAENGELISSTPPQLPLIFYSTRGGGIEEGVRGAAEDQSCRRQAGISPNALRQSFLH